MGHTHAAIWLDHRDAHVIRFSRDVSETAEAHSHREDHKIHRKSGVVGSGHVDDDHAFFDEIVGLVAEIPEVLIVGPGLAKTAFRTYVDHRHADLSRRVAGIETLGRVSDGELEKFARKRFKAVDQLGLI